MYIYNKPLSGVLLDMIYFKKLTWTTYDFLDVNKL